MEDAEDRRPSALGLFDKRQNHFAVGGVETGRRLVQQQRRKNILT
jgi:hypothetical protein